MPTIAGNRTRRRAVSPSRCISRDPGNVSPPVRFECAFDKQKLHNCGKTARATLKLGKHVLRAAAIDAQDNRSKLSFARFTVVKKKK